MNRINCFITIFILATGCSEMSGIRGKGQKVHQELDLKAFDKIELHILADIYLSPGEDQKVSVEAQENILKNLKTKVSDKKLIVTGKSNVRLSKRVTFHITIPEIKELIYNGSGKIRTTDFFIGQGDIELETEDLGDLDLQLEAKSIHIEMRGTGDVELEGKTDELKVEISGPGSLDAYGMLANRCEAEIEGSGSVKVNVRDKLVATVRGRGSILYRGSPEVVTESTGSGKIRSVR